MTDEQAQYPPVPKNAIFVFGSNLAGRHGKGAALTARQQYGAIYGQGIGLQGKSYAIPTKDEHLRVLPLHTIAAHVRHFLSFARSHPQLRFALTPIGCGLAGYKEHQIAPLFADAPLNVIKPQGWDKYRSPSTAPVSKLSNQPNHEPELE